MILPIRKVGGGPNISELTADPGDVLAAEKFIGTGSEEPQVGKSYSAVVLNMPCRLMAYRSFRLEIIPGGK